MQKLTLGLINFYQRYLSPYKGFRCASGVYYQEGTCSGIVKEIVREQGLISGWRDIKAQFQKCREAAIQLSEQTKKKNRSPFRLPNRKSSKSSLCCDSAATAACVLPDPSDCGLGVVADSAAGACSCL